MGASETKSRPKQTDVPTSLGDFVGRWVLSRRINDRLTGQIGRVSGVLIMSDCPEGLSYREEVTVQIPGQPAMEGTREYLWKDAGDSVDVHFSDGRSFHRFKLGQATPHAEHWCDPDQYDVEYDFKDWPVWGATWIVKGPRKDYKMSSLLVKEARRKEAGGT